MMLEKVPRVVLGLLSVLAPVAGMAEPQISIEESQVVAEGITPGGLAVWFGFAREQHEWVVSLVRREGMTQADASGVATFSVAEGVPMVSLWAVVDLATGQRSVAAPEDMPLQQVDFPADGLGEGGPHGVLNLLQLRRDFLEVLVVRPGVGAWGISSGDGGESDADAQPDGRVQVLLGLTHPIGDSAGAPSSFQRGDVIVVFDPNTLEYYSLQVGRAL